MVVAGLKKGLGKGEFKVYSGSTSGPTSYSSGGFNITVNGLSKIHTAIVTFKGSRPDDLVYQLDVSWSGNVITVKVMSINVTAASPVSWTEVAAGTDLSGLTFDIIVIGE